MSFYENIIEKTSEKLESMFDDYAVALTSIDRTMIKYANSQPSVIQSWRWYELAVYLVKDRRSLVTTLQNPSEREIDELVRRSALSLERMEALESLPEFPATGRYDPIYAVDGKVIEARSDLRNIMDVVSSKIEGSSEVAGMISLGKREFYLRTSAGFEGHHESTFFNGYFRVFRDDRSGQWAFTSTFYDEKMLEQALTEANFYANLNLRYVKPEEGLYTVILSPMVAGNLFNLLAFMSSAFSIQNGLSFLKPDQLNQEVASLEVSLHDVPKRVDLPMNAPFDAEGTPTYDKPIIENGVFRNVLHNTATAKRFGARSTGNAGWIEPTPWSLEVREGDADLDEMIRDTRRGILFNNNWYTRFQNYTTGEFSTVGRDAIVLIESGEMKGLIRKARLSSSFPTFLREIKAVGKRRYKIEWWEVEKPTLIPYIMADNIRITVPEYPS